jgi:hypothetical protein
LGLKLDRIENLNDDALILEKSENGEQKEVTLNINNEVVDKNELKLRIQDLENKLNNIQEENSALQIDKNKILIENESLIHKNKELNLKFDSIVFFLKFFFFFFILKNRLLIVKRI